MKMYQPQNELGILFDIVAHSGIFHDDKIWADAIPLFPLDHIIEEYERVKNKSDFDLKSFVTSNFKIEEISAAAYKTDKSHTLDHHINVLWRELERKDVNEQSVSTSIVLPYTYIIPGGRFKEIYYWDSYFTMLGLRIHDKWELIESMVNNFSWMIGQFGFIPNGSRTYYLTRSQPPFFALMVELLSEKKGNVVFPQFLNAMLAEYKFFTDSAPPRTILLEDGQRFSKYYDMSAEPRIEMYSTDIRLKNENPQFPDILGEIRAACESGWDFSSRWFDDSQKLERIKTSKIIPVDLECLLWQLEHTISKAFLLAENKELFNKFSLLADNRQKRIHQYFWNESLNFYCDRSVESNAPSNILTLAGLYPLFFKLVEQQYADLALKVIEKNFLKNGGLVTTLTVTGQQWDSPNGWAPLQWIAFKAAMNYGHENLASEIAKRWVNLNEKVFYKTGKMLEKYNVVDINEEGGGGEYPVQDGFGWTNGVYLSLKASLNS